TWDRGTINADTGYTIANNAGSGFGASGTLASFTVAANSGLNGLAMGTAGIPTLLTLGANSSFIVASSTAATRTYEVGPTGASNNVVTPATGAGGFTFGINNTSTVQTINLNRDKGADTITLLSKGVVAGSAINIAANQTGAANLMVDADVLNLNAGVTFGGTGGIYNDIFIGNSGFDGVLSNAAGQVSGSTGGTGGYAGIAFNVNGTLSGTNTISLNAESNGQGKIALGSTAVIGGTQTWKLSGFNGASVFVNNLTTPANWTSGSVSMNAMAGGLIEASTNTTTPGSSSNYKFNALSLTVFGSQTTAYYALTNLTQNDGSPGQNEAVYASSFNTAGFGDNSNSLYHFNFKGQSIYLDSFSNYTTNSRGLVLVNDALSSVSEFKAIGTQGGTMINGGFMAINGATLSIVPANYYGNIFWRNTGGFAADTAAAPNGTLGTTDIKTTLTYNGTTGEMGAFTSFLGSGNDGGTNGSITTKNTNGTLRVLGGHMVSSSYILNPVGVTGLIDTTGTSGATGSYAAINDTTLDNVTIRSNASQAATVATNVFTPTTKQIYANGDVVQFTGFSGVGSTTLYYVVNATATTFQVSSTQGGAAMTGISGSGNVTDVSGNGNASVYSGLIVGGTTTVNGNLIIGYAPGATNQATLRVGGDSATGYSTSTGPAAHSGNGSLIVTGDLTTEIVGGTSVNVSIQSNG
ncbi:MAG: hypothetical protein WCL11_28045, partial [Verrucomicrobiota bacterium]